MRKLLLIIAVILLVLGIAFTILPLGTIAFIPTGLAFLLSFLAFKKSTSDNVKLPQIVLIVSIVTLIAIGGKTLFVKPKVVVDEKFEQVKEDNKKQDIQDLEDL